jgi:hypothetical protein
MFPLHLLLCGVRVEGMHTRMHMRMDTRMHIESRERPLEMQDKQRIDEKKKEGMVVMDTAWRERALEMQERLNLE